MLPMDFTGSIPVRERAKRAMSLLDMVGIADPTLKESISPCRLGTSMDGTLRNKSRKGLPVFDQFDDLSDFWWDVVDLECPGDRQGTELHAILFFRPPG